MKREMTMNELNAVLELLGMLLTDPRMLTLLALLAAAAVIDVRTYRIPNWLTGGGIVAAFGFQLAMPAVQQPGLLWCAGGMLAGLAIMLPAYVLRVMGAGDVKLMAMVGAFLGYGQILQATLATFLIGGIAAIVFAISRRAAGRMLTNVGVIVQGMLWSAIGGARLSADMEKRRSVGRVPYGVSIAVGTSAYLVGAQLGLI